MGGYSLVNGAENVSHHFYKLQHTFVINVVKNTVGFFFTTQDVFFSKNGQVLRNIALAGADLINNVLYADRIGAEHAQYF